MGAKPKSVDPAYSEPLLMEMEVILCRISDLLRMLTDEIVVFEYFLEKYRLLDPDLE